MVSRLIAGLLASLCAAVPVAAQVASGSYGPLHLVVRDGRVAGIYDQRIGVGVSEIACVFLLEGPATAGGDTFRAWLPGMPETATVTLEGVREGVLIRMNDPMPGCPMAAGDLTREGQSLAFDQARPDWRDLGVVVRETAPLRLDSATGDPARAALVRYDAVAILDRKGDWLLVERPDRNGPPRGWTHRASIVSASGASN